MLEHVIEQITRSVRLARCLDQISRDMFRFFPPLGRLLIIADYLISRTQDLIAPPFLPLRVEMFQQLAVLPSLLDVTITRPKDRSYSWTISYRAMVNQSSLQISMLKSHQGTLDSITFDLISVVPVLLFLSKPTSLGNRFGWAGWQSIEVGQFIPFALSPRY